MRVNPQIIIQAFKKTGRASITARTLSITRMSVYRWLKKAKTMIPKCCFGCFTCGKYYTKL